MGMMEDIDKQVIDDMMADSMVCHIPDYGATKSNKITAINERLTKIIRFAYRKHGAQKRKDGTPYFRHCSGVAHKARDIADHFRCGDLREDAESMYRCIAIGFCHDLLEDTTTDYDDIAKIAGKQVADSVAVLTDDKRLSGAVRHEVYKNILGATTNWEVQAVKLADIIDNALDSQELPLTLYHGFLAKWVVKAKQTVAVLELVNHVPSYTMCQQTLEALEQRLAQPPLIGPLHATDSETPKEPK